MAQEEASMINKKTIIILVAAVLVLAAATTAVFMWAPSEDKDEDNPSETIYIWQENADDMQSIDVNLPDDSFTLVKGDEDKWSIKGLEGAAVKNYSISMLASDLAAMTAKSVVEENAADLAKYGLAEPEYSISANFADGSKKTYYGGNKTAMGDGYYFKDADSETVYTIYASKFESLFAEKSSYRDITLLKVDSNKIMSINIDRADVKISIKKMEAPETVEGYTLASWEMTSPVAGTVDDSQLSTNVLEKLTSIGVTSVASDKGDFAAYGLDKPYATVTLSDEDGVTQTLKIGNLNGDDRYVSTDGDKTVYTVAASTLDFASVDAFKLATKFVNIAYIDKLDKITVSANGETYTLSASGEGDNRKYMFNGAEADTDKFKKDLYQAVIGLICNDFCNDAKYGVPDVTVEYSLNDGTHDKVELVNYDDRNYAVFKNGACSMKILKKDVKSMLDALKNFK